MSVGVSELFFTCSHTHKQMQSFNVTGIQIDTEASTPNVSFFNSDGLSIRLSNISAINISGTDVILNVDGLLYTIVFVTSQEAVTAHRELTNVLFE